MNFKKTLSFDTEYVTENGLPVKLMDYDDGIWYGRYKHKDAWEVCLWNIYGTPIETKHNLKLFTKHQLQLKLAPSFEIVALQEKCQTFKDVIYFGYDFSVPVMFNNIATDIDGAIYAFNCDIEYEDGVWVFVDKEFDRTAACLTIKLAECKEYKGNPKDSLMEI